ncbi:MAG: hypothetical protein U1B80_04935, partial [Anaerolineaceae bacterium]|nr:hypothetical protein [Anaerolineaceae bacterium]
ENPTGNLLNEYDWGGYLVWNMREWQVYVDGRTYLYGDEIIGQWITAVQAEKGWQDVLEGWDIRYALLKPNRPLVTVLEMSGWERMASSDHWVLLKASHDEDQ